MTAAVHTGFGARHEREPEKAGVPSGFGRLGSSVRRTRLTVAVVEVSRPRVTHPEGSGYVR